MGCQGPGFKVMLASRVCSCTWEGAWPAFFSSLYFWTFLSMWQETGITVQSPLSAGIFSFHVPQVLTRALASWKRPSPHFFLLLHPFFFSSSSATGLETHLREGCALSSCSVAQSERLTQAHSTLDPEAHLSLSACLLSAFSSLLVGMATSPTGVVRS